MLQCLQKIRYSQVMFISYIKLNTINFFRGLMDKALDCRPKGREFESCCRRFFNDFFYLLIYSFIIVIIKLIFCLNFSFRYVLQNWHNSLKFDCIKTAANAPLIRLSVYTMNTTYFNSKNRSIPF